jgi:hypothetical protein
MAPLILNLVIRWKRVVNFIPWPLYLREGAPVPIEQGDGWAQRLSGLSGGQKILPPPAGIRTPKRLVHGLVTTPAPKFDVTVMYVIDIIQNWPFKNISNP